MPLNDVTRDTIKKWLDFALQQVAAESYWNLQSSPLPETRAQILQRGNSPRDPAAPTSDPDQYVAMTTSQATSFLGRYQIVDHHANDSSGFSATLLFDSITNTYTLALRSTEYKNPSLGGDYDRDGFYGADGEIKNDGFAFGQLAALEDYYSALRADPQKLAGKGPINVVGYSLSGNLALTFTELHPQDVIQTYTFNSAGRGRLRGVADSQQVQKIAEMLAYYRQVLLDPDAADPRAKEAPNGKYQLAKARAILDPSWQPFASIVPDQFSLGRRNLYEDPRGDFARFAVERRYSFDFSIPIAFPPSPAGSPLYTQPGKVTQLFGHANHGDSERVANSGVHPEATPVLIEGQPFIEGAFGKVPVIPEWTQWLSKFGDFGNTHSLTLIIDSLAVMAVFMAAASSLTKRQAEAIFAGASNQRAGFWGQVGPTAEGNTLEAALDELRKLYGASGKNNSSFGQLDWITPSSPINGGFGSRPNREVFHDHIKRLQDAIDAKGPVTSIENLISGDQFSAALGEPVVGAVAIDLTQAIAKAKSAIDPDGIAYRYTLRELLPFVAKGNNALFSPHNLSGELNLADPAAGSGLITTEWVNARAEMLAVKLQRNRDNVGLTYKSGNENWVYDDQRLAEKAVVVGTAFQQVIKSNISERNLSAFLEKGTTHKVLFDADQNPQSADVNARGGSLDGGKYADKLFGGGGNDVLRGNEGDDYLEGGKDQDSLYGGDNNDILVGGKDADTLYGGTGTDTYCWNVGDGFDQIMDTPEGGVRLGKIESAGLDLTGVKTLYSNDNDKLYRDNANNLYAFQGELGKEGILTIVKQGEQGGVRILAFKNGDLGITLNPASYSPPTLTQLDGTNVDDNFYSSVSGHHDSLAATVADQKVYGYAGNDRIRGSYANNELYGGLGRDVISNGPDDQKLFGEQGNDILLATSGNDELRGGSGDDVLQGGTGDDVLIGGPDDAIPTGESDHDLIDGGPGADTIIGGDGNDMLVGGGNLAPQASVMTSDPETVTYGYKQQADGSMMVMGMAGYEMTAADPFGLAYYGADGYINVDGDLADFIDGGAGNDFILAGDGDDVVQGGIGDDFAVGQAGSDLLQGGTGADKLLGDGVPGSVTFTGSLVGGDGSLYTLPQYHGADVLIGDAGDDVLQGDGGADQLYGGADNDVLDGDAYADKLPVQFHGNDYLDGGTGNDLLYGVGGMDMLYGGDGDDELQGDAGPTQLPYANHADDFLSGDAGNDTLVGGGGADILYGGTGNDSLAGDGADVPQEFAGDDYLDGESGNDELQGDYGKDTLVAGAGDDTLLGGRGDDLYLVNQGDGQDTIIDGYGTNMVRFGAGITPESLSLSQGVDPQGLGYLIVNYGGGSRLSIQGGFNGVQLFEFADGKKLSPFTLYLMLTKDTALPSSVGTTGADTLDTGPVSVNVIGDTGTDTYRVSRSSGWSTIIDQGSDSGDRVQFAPGIAQSDVHFRRRSNGNLDIEITEPDDATLVTNRLTVSGQYADAQNRIESFEFDDGTVIDAAALDALALAELVGTDADDELEGSETQGETYVAKGGTDTIRGGSANDVYRYSVGDGADTITDIGGFDRISLTDLDPEDVAIERQANGDLVLTAGDGGSVTVAGNFNSAASGVELISFGDGNFLNQSDLASIAVTPVFGTDADDELAGGLGDDTLYSFDGDDTLDGGVGNDALLGGAGADTYRLDYNSGRDTLIEEAGGTNVLELGATIDFDGLRAVREGDDAVISIRGAQDAVTLQNYFAVPQDWVMTNAAEETQSVDDLIAATTQADQDWRGSLKRDFLASQKAGFVANYLNQGYSIRGDGLLGRDDYPTYNAIWQVGYQTTVRTYTPLIPGGVSGTQTFHYEYPTWNYVAGTGGAVYHYSAQFAPQTLQSDDSFISSPTRGTTHTDTFAIDWLKITWKMGHARLTSQSHSTSGGFVTGPIDPATGEPIVYSVYTDVNDSAWYETPAVGTTTDVPPNVTPYYQHYTLSRPPYTQTGIQYTLYQDKIYEVDAGDSDNYIQGGDVVDAGGGNDTVFMSTGTPKLVFGGAGNDYLYVDSIYYLAQIYGEDGSDQIQGYGALYGGAGDDYIWGNGNFYGGDGNDSLSTTWGRSGVQDGGAGNDALTGRAALFLPGAGDDTVYSVGGGSRVAVYSEQTGTKVISAWEGAGDADTLDLVDVAIEDLSLGWGLISANDTPHVTLDIGWGSDGVLRVVMPRSEELAGSGFEWFVFNGVTYSRAELLAFAPAAPDFDPMNVVIGTEFDDWLEGSGVGDRMLGLGGDDLLAGFGGPDILAGGDGNDQLEGGEGADRYVFEADEQGIDVINDQASDAFAYIDGYYADLGIENWQNRAAHAGQYFADGGEGQAFFDTYQEAYDFAPWADIIYFEPLPSIVPFVERDDDVALGQLIDDGVVAEDVVAFGEGLLLSDLAITVRVLSGAAAQHPEQPWYGGGTLSVRWGNAGFDLEVPDVRYGFTGPGLLEGLDALLGGNGEIGPGEDGDWRGYRLGEGIETFEFSNGTSYSLEQILQMATVEAVSQPFLFYRYEGNESISRFYDAISFQNEIRDYEVQIRRDGVDLLIDASGTQGRVEGWYADPNSLPTMHLEFEFDSQIDAETLTELGLTVQGSDDDDLIEGLDGFSDVLYGNWGRDELRGNGGNDFLYGGEYDDTLDGGAGDDVLDGGQGDDEFVLRPGGGHDRIENGTPYWNSSGDDIIRAAGGLAPGNVLISRTYTDLAVWVRGSTDRIQVTNWFEDPNRRLGGIAFANGTFWTADEMEARIEPAPGTDGDDTIFGSEGDDFIDALGGDDSVQGGDGDDVILGGAGSDSLNGEGGVDLLYGGEGEDDIEDWSGAGLFDGGAGDDYVYDEGTAFVAGGTGNDWIDHWSTGTVIAFNAGDGEDTIYAGGSFTLSLGGGIVPADLALSRDGTDLLLSIGGSDSIRLSRQYEEFPEAWPEITLQMFGSVHRYDLNAVIDDFYAALAADPELPSFPLDGVLQSHQTGFSETEALGGALSAHYAATGQLTGLRRQAVVGILSAPEFGYDAQPIDVPLFNSAPQLDTPIADQLVGPDGDFEFTIPGSAFFDPNGDALHYSATLANGSPLPGWLSLNGATGTFSGTPVPGLDLEITVIVADGDGASAQDTFSLTWVDVLGTAGDDSLDGTSASETIYGLQGDDEIFGGGGADTFRGGPGRDYLAGGIGNDTYLYSPGDEIDDIEDDGGNDELRFGSGITPEDVLVSKDPYGNLYLQVGGRQSQINILGASGDGQIEQVQFADGTVWGAADLQARLTTFAATEFDDILSGGTGDDLISGLAGNDEIYGGAGNDILSGGEEDDYVEGNSGHNLLLGEAGNDDVESGVDAGRSFFIGGEGYDYVGAYGGHDVVAFNAGDGADYVSAGGGENLTISLGGIEAADIRFTRTDDGHFTIELGGSDSIAIDTFADQFSPWPTAKLQIIGDDIRTYDLTNMIGLYTLQWSSNPSLIHWSIEPVLEANLLSVSSNTAIGGAIAYQYATSGSVAGLAPESVRATLAEDAFGVDPQAVNPGADIVGTDDGEGLQGTSFGERIYALGGDDSVYAGGGNDILFGGEGAFDYLEGGEGDDTYVYESGDGIDGIWDEAGEDTLQMGVGIAPDQVKVIRDPWGTVYMLVDGLQSRLEIYDWLNGHKIEQVEFDDGTVWTAAQVEARLERLAPTEGDDFTGGTDGEDVIDGLAGDDYVFGNAGNDVLAGGTGADSVEGNAGHNLLLGGEGDDYLTGGFLAERDLAIGGAGNDNVSMDGTATIAAFNAGDGSDSVYASPGQAFVLSLGGIAVGDIRFNRTESGQFFLQAAADSLDIYAYFYDPANWPSATLQTIGGDIRTYDLNAVVQDFYDAGSPADWSAVASLESHLLSVSTTEAFGGAIAYQYATTGSTAGLSTAQIQSVLGDANFSVTPQAIVVAGNQAPLLDNAIADVAAAEDAAFSLTVAADAFSDPDADALTYTATLDGGSELPAWLSFDAETQTFSGTPLQADVGAVDVRVTASDGDLSADDTFTLTVNNVNDAPVVSAANAQLLLNDSVAAASLLSVSDGDGDAIVGYEFWDDVAGGGHWAVDGVEQAAAQSISVSGLQGVEYVAGANPGTEQVWVRASDGMSWSAWKPWNMTSALHIPNAAPTVSVSNATVLLGQGVDAASLFSAGDADGDPIARYEFWDSTAGNGHFTVNGAEQGANVAIGVAAADLAATQFVGSDATGSDLVWVRASDGQSWGEWKSWTMNSWPHAVNATPVASAQDVSILTNQAVEAASLFTVSDADGDPIAQYEFWDDANGGGYWRVDGVQQGAAQTISASDLEGVEYVGGASAGAERVWVRANDGLEWSAWKPWNITTALHIPNATPVVSASDTTLLLDASAAASSLFSVADADSDSITKYEFWDSTAGNGHWSIGGVAQGVNVTIAVSADDLANTTFTASSGIGSDLVWARANDGQAWSDWESWHVASAPHVTNSAPVVTASNAELLVNDSADAASLFSVTDLDGDAIAGYEFWDDVAGGGHWTVDGVEQAAGQSISVSDLGSVQYAAGANPGSEQAWVRASDGMTWSAWKSWTVTSALHIPNAAPTVSASNATVLLGQGVDASSLFSSADADGDAITQYEFWDSTAGSGHFTVNGVEQGVNVSIGVTAAQLANTQFQASPAIGSDLVWVRANDGQSWSDWKSWYVASAPHLINAAPVVSAAASGLLRDEAVQASILFSVSDADADPITQYEFWDDVNGGGHWEVNGVQQAAAQTISVSDLQNVEYVGGANAGTEQVWARASDGMAWSGWKNWLMSTEGGMLRGGLAPDTLTGEAGPTVLEGGGGGDDLTDTEGNNVFNGGEGDDSMTGGAGNDLFVGGGGNDTAQTGEGSNVVAYDAGGGFDTVYSAAGASNTLSLGGGIGYNDLSLSRDGNDLLVNTGGDNKIAFKDWYAGKDNVEKLQLVLDASGDYDSGSIDPLYGKKVQTFDFLGMVAQFDAAYAQSPGLSSWALTNALLAYHLSASDDAALGGDLAYWYGKNGALTGISLNAAQQVLGAANFGADAQTLRPFDGLQEGFVKLS